MLKGVGRPDEYHCGAEHADGTFEFCKGASGSTDSDVQCAGVPSDSIHCLEDCGDWWYQCANGAAFVKPVPLGTKCRGAEFVVEAVCEASASTAAPSSSSSSTAAPSSSSSSTVAPSSSSSSSLDSQSTTVASEPSTEASTTAAPSTEAPTTAE